MQKIAERQVGHQTILNTEWPIIDIVYRVGPRRYSVSWGVCNGIASSSTEYRTRREALAAIEEN